MKELLSKHLYLSEDGFAEFISKAKQHTYRKREHLLNANEPVKKLFFIEKGLVRGYRILDGNDITHHFYVENWFATDYESYLTNTTGELYLQALCDTNVYAFEKRTLLSLFEAQPKFEKIRSIMAEQAYLQMVARLKDLQTNDLKERYHNLIRKSPELFSQVSQKHIASYLGVAPQSLSRIRNSLKNTKS
ncbi:Crp/Fnr family transcriptional regulator [Aureisphaera galaxeae]|uniref:Crp/Fnr family transcriptional regulator n=1 Tax=Aureisphaera galaxeae TaxID=1538023 RepID=UPI002350CE09|nr:Crp/Fnr family transcriptional regulator [Aureisphaera galaxeae]MDC8002484.1 Crp/Fnr family transcriptional regulator [Aureisphaera galaxeae]